MSKSNPNLRVEVLLVTADLTDCPALTRIFSHSNWKLRTCRTILEASRVIRSHPVGVVICKEMVSDGNWKGLLNTNSQPNHPKLFVASSSATAHLWSEALREGADYVLTNAYTRLNDHSYQIVIKVDGALAATATVVISPDGKTLTTVTNEKNAQGQDIRTTTVYDKQ